ncbi:MAG: XisI protein [Chloroflexota bacterium]
MDTKLNYSEIIKSLLQAYSDHFKEDGESPLKPIFDDIRHRYLLLYIYWNDQKYIHQTPIHIDIINNKIWIQYDNTEEGIATDLLEAGVPAEEIVLGFYPDYVRQHTEFAVA